MTKTKKGAFYSSRALEFLDNIYALKNFHNIFVLFSLFFIKINRIVDTQISLFH